MQNLFKGTGVALVTPFNSELQIDYNSFEKLLEFNARGGVNYFVVNGTTGESATTSKKEKRDLLKFIRENNPNKLPIVYGTGGYDTLDIVAHVREMDWTGVDALLSVSPYYNRPSQKGIIAHYEAIANACPVPLIMYNVPKRTGSNMSASTTIELSKHENIIGIKEASGDFGQIVDIVANKPDDFLLISGDDMCTVPMISIGAIGVISVLANAFPKEMSSMAGAALESDYTTAQSYLPKLSHINPYMYSEASPVGIKEVLRQLGICENYVRLPLVAPSMELTEIIKGLI
ncbi:MAG: 4-hydroxy-tetrahydrodipicolinate synthase [Cyclobacteriaceae bacterium]|nr:4-hydroxy-tetrahydrodipicolinate synthase [Cyclobacteriaceae bacterium]